MKNKINSLVIIALIAIIGFTIAACDQVDVTEATTNGQLTITGLSAHIGKKIEATHHESTLWLVATGRAENFYQSSDDTSGPEKTYPPTINGDEVILKVFYLKNPQHSNLKGKNNGGYHNYTGNHPNVQFTVHTNEGYVFGSVTVNFTNGIGSGVFVPNP